MNSKCSTTWSKSNEFQTYDGAKVKVFGQFESESARRRHCLCFRPAPTPLVEIFTGPSTTTGTRSNDGEGDDFFLPSRVFQVYDCYFTNVLTQRSCLGFLLTADSQCFTRNDARTFVPTIPRRRLWLGERSLELKRQGLRLQQKCGHLAPPSPVSSPSKYPPSFVACAFNKAKPSLSSIAVVTKAIKRTARTSLSHLGTSTTLFPAIGQKPREA